MGARGPRFESGRPDQNKVYSLTGLESSRRVKTAVVKSKDIMARVAIVGLGGVAGRIHLPACPTFRWRGHVSLARIVAS